MYKGRNLRPPRNNKKGAALNWKLILQLSLFGLAMGLATVFFISSKIEPLFWLAIFLFSAYVIARACPTPASRFLHGLLLGLANCVWIVAAHVIFATRYLATHAQEAAMMQSSPLSPRLALVFFGALAGIGAGVVIGLLALLAGLMVKPAAPASA